MQRYFVDFLDQDQLIYINSDNDDYHHIKNVMRMKVSDELYLSNNQKVIYAKITEMTNEYVLCEKLYDVKSNQELTIHVTIAQGLPKSDKLELVIQKTTELGVSEIIPVSSERSIIKLDGNKEEKKLTRYRKIAKEASEQSHRIKIPTITSVMSINELIHYAQDFDHKLVAYEASDETEERNFKDTVKQLKDGDRLLVFIGPEGGISIKELNQLKEHNFKVISLGSRILRTETAPLFIMSALTYALELKG